jgi:hypothetical protein
MPPKSLSPDPGSLFTFRTYPSWFYWGRQGFWWFCIPRWQTWMVWMGIGNQIDLLDSTLIIEATGSGINYQLLFPIQTAFRSIFDKRLQCQWGSTILGGPAAMVHGVGTIGLPCTCPHHVHGVRVQAHVLNWRNQSICMMIQSDFHEIGWNLCILLAVRPRPTATCYHCSLQMHVINPVYSISKDYLLYKELGHGSPVQLVHLSSSRILMSP